MKKVLLEISVEEYLTDDEIKDKVTEVLEKNLLNNDWNLIKINVKGLNG